MHKSISNELIGKFMGYDVSFHSSWDHIFPVFEKIQTMGYPYLISNGTVSIYKVWQEEFIAHKHNDDTKLAAYDCILGFIKAFNKNELNHEQSV